MSSLSALSIYTQKTLRYLKKNGVSMTLKKISRRINGKNWVSRDEDTLYILHPFTAPEEQV